MVLTLSIETDKPEEFEPRSDAKNMAYDYGLHCLICIKLFLYTSTDIKIYLFNFRRSIIRHSNALKYVK